MAAGIRVLLTFIHHGAEAIEKANAMGTRCKCSQCYTIVSIQASVQTRIA